MWKLVVLAGVSAITVWVSWCSLRDWRSHGSYRFFAWESILLLILLNLDRGFADPFSPLHPPCVATVDGLTVSGDTRLLLCEIGNLVLIATASLIATAKVEEAENMQSSATSTPRT